MQTYGFVKVHRSLLDWEWYGDKNTCRLFLHILLRVNYRDVLWKNEVIKRGSMVTSVQALAQETGLSVQQTRNALKHLQDNKQITIQSTNKYSVVTVVKYASYQDTEGIGSKQTNEQVNKQTGKQTTNKPTTREEIKKNKNTRIQEERVVSAEADTRAPVRTDYQQITDAFNRICTSLPQVQSVSDKRRQAIRTASQTVGDIAGWEKLFRTVEQSDFLTGRNGSWQGCGFDWILKPANLVKILEGNYTDKPDRKEADFHDNRISFGTML